MLILCKHHSLLIHSLRRILSCSPCLHSYSYSYSCPSSSNIIQLIRTYSSDRKHESYFSAIGGDSDEPPPDLTPQQVTTILRTNEQSIGKSIKRIKQIECNQLASNHPCEDRMRIAKFKFSSLGPEFASFSDTLALAVIDGHGGGSCADVIARRLFHYVALSLLSTIRVCDYDILDKFVENLYLCPNPDKLLASIYDEKGAKFLSNALNESERKALQKYAQELTPSSDIEKALVKAFKSCDQDLSREIEQNLLSSPSNILLHYYLSLAVSGCCVTLLLVHQDMAYVASCGDCKAVLGTYESLDDQTNLKTIPLSKEHNSENVNELKRIFAEHPKAEQNNIIRNGRLLGQLMPLRAMGDFNYKWPIETIKKLGLMRAFGSHIIPPYYLTPPYLESTPEIDSFSLERDIEDMSEKFIILATDGLWEQFDLARNAVKCVFKQKQRLNRKAEYDSVSFYETKTLETISKPSSSMPINSSPNHIEDINCATHLIRTALGVSPTIDPHLDPRHQQHSRLVTYLTLPQSVVRNFRDDISLIVVDLN